MLYLSFINSRYDENDAVNVNAHINNHSSSNTKQLNYEISFVRKYLTNIFSSFFIQNLWDLLNGLSFLSALALISISMPSSDVSKKLMSQILDFVFMNCLMTDRWLDPLLFHKDFFDEAYN